MIEIKQITEYLSEHIADPIPEYIYQREILKTPASSPDYIHAYDAARRSKWYRELAGEQWEDGSWGRFHTQDSKSGIKQKFVTTERALIRARQLSLTKDDPVVAKCVKLMERYIRGEETWRDNIEKHHDNGKSHLRSRLFVAAAWLNLFEPENPLMKPKRDVLVETLKAAMSKGYFDEAAWTEENLTYRGPCLNGWNMFPVMILQNSDCIDDALQRQYLNYLWNRKDGVYYLAGFPLSEKQSVEDKKFNVWLYTLEFFTGFSLFPELMQNDVLPHLLNETRRLIDNNAVIPASYDVRYAESWRDREKRKTDVILRIARILAKC